MSNGGLRDIVVLACGASAGIHAALAPEHLAEAAPAGAGFLAAAVVLAGVVVAMTMRPASTRLVAVAASTLAGLILSYALVLAGGIPVLHPEPESANGLALVTKAIELVGVVAALCLLVPRSSPFPLTHAKRRTT